MKEEYQQTGSLLVFGVGCQDTHAQRRAALSAPPARVIVVDPLIDPDTPPAGLVKGSESTDVIAGVVGKHDGQAELCLWSANGLMGAREPLPALHSLLPGLRRTLQVAVAQHGLESLLANLGKLPAPIAVWIDMAGAEEEIFALVMASSLRAQVACVTVRCGIEPFFEGALDCEALIAMAGQQGWTLGARTDEDPDFPDLQFVNDGFSLSGAATTAEEPSAASDTRADDMEHKIDAVSAELDEAKRAARAAELKAAAADKKLKDLKKQRDAANRAKRAADKQTAKDKAELAGVRAVREEIETRLQDALARLAAREADREALRKQIAELTDLLDADRKHADARIAALESELAATTSKAEQSGQQLAEREQTLTEQQARLAEVEADLVARDATLAALKADLAGREAALAEARTAADEAGSRAADLQQALDTARAEAQAQAQEQDARIAALEEEFKAISDKAEWRRKRIGELEQVAKDLEDRIAEANHKTEKAHADLSVATRMQALLQTDLNDLRERLEKAQEIRAAQEALLTKLTPRLQQAADQLRLLQLGQNEDSPAIVSAAVSLMGSEPAQPRASKRSRSKRGADVASTTR